MREQGVGAMLREALSDRIALSIFLLALCLRVAWVVYIQISHPGESYYLAGDADEYTTVANNLLSGNGWVSSDRGGSPYEDGPVLPLYLAAIFVLGGSFFTVTLANALVGALTCWGVVRLGRRLTTPAGALIAGLVMAIYPYFFHYTGHLATETLSVLFGLLVFASLIALSREPSYRNAVLAGLFLGLATLNHPETYVTPTLLILWAFVGPSQRRGLVLGRVVLVIVVCGVTVLPWHAYHAVKYGKSLFLPPGLGASGLLAQSALDAKARIEGDTASYQGKAAELAEKGITLEKEHGAVVAMAVAVKQVLGDLKNHPAEYVEFLGLKFETMWGLAPKKGRYAKSWIIIPTGILNGLIYLGCIAGFFLHRHRGESLLAVVLMASYTIPHLIFYSQPRYRLPVMPVVILLAGVAASFLFERVVARRRLVAGSLAEGRRRSA